MLIGQWQAQEHTQIRFSGQRICTSSEHFAVLSTSDGSIHLGQDLAQSHQSWSHASRNGIWIAVRHSTCQTLNGDVQDTNLKHSLQFGIGLHHAGLKESDGSTVEHLFVAAKIQVC